MLSGTEDTRDQMNTWEIYRPVFLLSWVSVPIAVVGGVESLSCVQLFVTPWTIAHQASLSMGFSRQEYWSELSFPSPGLLPNPGLELRPPALAVRFFTRKPPRKLPCLLPWGNSECWVLPGDPLFSKFIPVSFYHRLITTLRRGWSAHLLRGESWYSQRSGTISKTWQVEGIGWLVPVWNSAPRTAFSHSIPTHSPEEI